MYPPEAVERRRYEKVAKALGTRTPQQVGGGGGGGGGGLFDAWLCGCDWRWFLLQVASHVQKYFIKLAKAGLPVPGRMPNMAAYATKSKKASISLSTSSSPSLLLSVPPSSPSFFLHFRVVE